MAHDRQHGVLLVDRTLTNVDGRVGVHVRQHLEALVAAEFPKGRQPRPVECDDSALQRVRVEVVVADERFDAAVAAARTPRFRDGRARDRAVRQSGGSRSVAES